MYRLMLYYLRALIAAAVVLSFFEILPYTWWHILAILFYLIAVCFTANQIFARLFKVKTNYESQFITAEILTLIIGPYFSIPLLLPLTVAGVAAMASKYIFVYQKRHIFNPAAAGALAMALTAHEIASWWVGNLYLLPVIAIGGIIMMWKLRWWHLSLTFLLSYLILLPVSFINLASLENLKYPFATIISPLAFFAFVMLVEPLTAPGRKKLRIIYGLGTAFILVLYQRFVSAPYTLELALLSGNILGRFLDPKPTIILKFQKKLEVAKNIYAFYFEPLKQFRFIPGQFLEWQLQHPHADSRGTRRWFTISSSPTQPEIILTTKFAENGSTFKSALKQLSQGDELTAVGPAGDFVLPPDKSRKLAFIAGGIGVTPFVSIINDLLDTNQLRDIILLYAAKTADEFAFQNAFSEAKKIGVNAVYIPTDEQGFITPQTIKEKILDWPERLFYVSGPEPMVEAYEKMLSSMGIKNIKRDYFPGYEEPIK